MTKWFNDKELGYAFGWIFFSTRVGLGLNSLFLPDLITENGNITFALYIGLIFLVFSWIISVFLIFIDKWYESREGMLGMMMNFYKEYSDESYNFSILKTFSL